MFISDKDSHLLMKNIKSLRIRANKVNAPDMRPGP